MDNRTWYDVLGISRNASFSEIRQRFRELSLKYHPDKQQQAVSQSLESIDTTMAPVFPNGTDFIELMQAWEILSDDAKRARYDAELICMEFSQHKLILCSIHICNNLHSYRILYFPQFIDILTIIYFLM